MRGEAIRSVIGRMVSEALVFRRVLTRARAMALAFTVSGFAACEQRVGQAERLAARSNYVDRIDTKLEVLNSQICENSIRVRQLQKRPTNALSQEELGELRGLLETNHSMLLETESLMNRRDEFLGR